MSALTLHTYWRSSCSYRVRIALGLKGLAYASVPVDLTAGAQRSPAHLALNPMGHVPALAIDGRVVVESVAIVELLEELFPAPPLYPSEPFARAEVRAMVECVNAGTQPLQNLHVLQRVGEGAAREAWARHFLARGLGALEALLVRASARGRFAFGDAIGAADAFLVPQVYNARRFGVDLAPYPRVVEVDAAARAIPAVAAAAPEAQPDAPRA